MADVVRAARDAGATSVWTNVLYLRPGTREHFLDNLARDWPALLPMYERLYAGGRAYVTKDVLEPVRTRVRSLAVEGGRRRPTASGHCGPSAADVFAGGAALDAALTPVRCQRPR